MTTPTALPRNPVKPSSHSDEPLDSGAAISVRSLVKRYGDLAAVDGLDLDVGFGEIVALLGPNGAGKTTTVEILEGYRSRTAGEVQVLGVDPARASADWRARIGIVLQSVNDLADLTVTEALNHFATYFPAPRDPAEVCAAVGLSDKSGTRVSRLSGGQRRRLDVGLGILGRPDLLFLDEPTTGFDPQARRQFWSLINDLRSAGTTVLLTTHYLEEAEELADRVAVIASGRLLEVGTPATLGGRATATATVSWLEAGQRREIATAEPTRVVGELAARYPGEVPELQVWRPSLEDIYLRMIADSAPDAPGAAPADAAHGSEARR